MIVHGQVKNGVIVLDDGAALMEGTRVQVDVSSSQLVATPQRAPRTGGQYAGQIWIAPDFDEWPDDIREAFGMNP